MHVITKHILLLTGAVLITLSSLTYIRYTPTPVGNICEKTPTNPHGSCYENLPQGGFPFSYLKDDGFISAPGRLGAEDRLDFFAFIVDLIFFYTLLYLTIHLGQKCRCASKHKH